MNLKNINSFSSEEGKKRQKEISEKYDFLLKKSIKMLNETYEMFGVGSEHKVMAQVEEIENYIIEILEGKKELYEKFFIEKHNVEEN